jgi:hemoglobin
MSDEDAGKPTLYDRLGGEAGLRADVERFYDIMQNDPEARPIWAMHKRGLDDLKDRLVAFLSSFVGGLVVYPSKYGAPMIRARHLPFPIGAAERDMWLRCAYQALAATFSDRPAAMHFAMGLTQFADHMRNSAEPPADQAR